jgi:hypothetical protein
MIKALLRFLTLLLMAPPLLSTAAPAKKLLIISPRAFQEALKDFVAWKQTLQPVEWVALEEILQKSAGADDPEKLKRFLYEEWRQHQIGYALLAGDVDVFPVRYMVLDRKTPAAFDYAFYPSDLYYADLARADGSFDDWNAQKDSFHAGYFGEVRGEAIKSDPINYDKVDYLPDIAVGRWPVSTPEEVRVIAGKSAAYEKAVLAGNDPNLHRAGFFSVGGWVDSRGLLGSLAKKLETGWKVEKRFYASSTPPPDHEQVKAFLNQGAGLMVHAGHGQPDAWERCFSTTDLAALTNSTSVPVIISAGCSTAHFAPLPPYEKYVDREGNPHRGTDRGEKFTEPPLPPSPYQTGKVNPGCLGEALLKRAGTGGVAYIGCNTGSQPFGLTLVDGFISELAQSKEPRLGDCWSSAIRYYVDHEKLRDLKPTESWTPPSVFFQGMKFMVFGDPSLRLPANAAPAVTPPPSTQ